MFGLIGEEIMNIKNYLLLVDKDASLILNENLKTSLLKSSNGFSKLKIIE